MTLYESAVPAIANPTSPRAIHFATRFGVDRFDFITSGSFAFCRKSTEWLS